MTDISLQQLETELTHLGISDPTLEALWSVDTTTIYGFWMDGAQALDCWKQLHAIKDIIGHYPLILGDAEELERHQEDIQFNSFPEDAQPAQISKTIEQGIQLVAKEWFDLTAQERQQDWEDFWSGDEELSMQREQGILDAYTLAEVGEWNSKILAADESITIPTDIRTRHFYPKVWIALIPTTLSWEVPAFLRFGNWNECPSPEVHVCLMKYWHEQYGAEIIGISHDVVEMLIKNPPTDRESAFNLAQEHYIYCSDTVEQGMQTLNNLAARLLNGKTWYFWWD